MAGGYTNGQDIAMARQRTLKAFLWVAVAGALVSSSGFVGPSAVADDTLRSGRNQSDFGAATSSPGESTFVPQQRLGDVQQVRPRTKLGQIEGDVDRARRLDPPEIDRRGLGFDRNNAAESREWLTPRGLDHRGAPANRRSPFFPDQHLREIGR